MAVRRRLPDSVDDDDRAEDAPLVLNMARHTSIKNVSCPELLELNPAKSGWASKKNNSMLAWLFPCLYEQWRERYFVLIGGFLFRFASDQGEAVKGVPIPLDCITTKMLGDGCIELSTLRKRYCVRVGSEKEATEWINAIQKRKMEAIRENMGHIHLEPEVKRINKIGSYLFDRRLEIDRLVARSSTQNPLDPTTASEFSM